MATQSFNNQMEKLRILIWNAAADELIQPRLELYSYTTEKLDQGKQLWQQTDAQNKKQDKEQAEQYAATDAFNASWQTAQDDLKRVKKIARLAFEGNANAWNQLNLKTINIDRFEDWMEDAGIVYKNLLTNSGWVAALQNYNYTPEKLTNLGAQIDELKTLQQEQKREMGDAQQATQDKWAWFNELKSYAYHLREIAKIEFENEPQLLEKLGIFIRS